MYLQEGRRPMTGGARLAPLRLRKQLAPLVVPLSPNGVLDALLHHLVEIGTRRVRRVGDHLPHRVMHTLTDRVVDNLVRDIESAPVTAQINERLADAIGDGLHHVMAVQLHHPAARCSSPGMTRSSYSGQRA